MATYTVNAGDVGIEAWTLTANQVDTITFVDNIAQVEVDSDGTAEVRVSTTGTATFPTGGTSTKSYRLPAGGPCTLRVTMPTTTDTVSILSTGTPKVSVFSVKAGA